jgi:hypothetical protein
MNWGLFLVTAMWTGIGLQAHKSIAGVASPKTRFSGICLLQNVNQRLFGVAAMRTRIGPQAYYSIAGVASPKIDLRFLAVWLLRFGVDWW